MTIPSTGNERSSLGSSEDPARCSSLDALLLEVQECFERHLKIDTLLYISKKLQGQLKESLTSSRQCMLPSHQFVLPSGKEEGLFLALEVGGSHLKVALVELKGQDVPDRRIQVPWFQSSPIEARMKEANGLAFFDWIALKIKDMFDSCLDDIELPKPMRMGIAWSFPLE